MITDRMGRGRRVMTFAWSFTLVAGAFAEDGISPDAGMLQYPDISASHIVFVYANDLWLAPRVGGMASPLASPPGQESFPRFSPDGQTIGFVGNYEGDTDLYTIPTAGGIAQRATYHPAAETLCDWTPDGRLLFFTNASTGLGRQTQLQTVLPGGGLPLTLPIPYGANGAISADGQWLAYTPHTHDNRTWKRYRGGMATDIWLFNLKERSSRRITDWEGTDSQPMWQGETVYYLCDQGPEHRLNIWSFHYPTGDRKQVTQFKDYDCKWPAMGPGPDGKGEIVLQNGPGLYRIELPEGRAVEVEVRIPGDRPTIRPRTVSVQNLIFSTDISSTGKRAALEARGDIWSVPAKNGAPMNLTESDGVAERSPAWSPDGRWIAYFSDATGEYELYVKQSDGKGETKQLTQGSKTFYYAPQWSPDSKWINYTDKAANLYLCNVESKEVKVVDTDPWTNPLSVSWSHDGDWFAYSRNLEATPQSVLMIYQISTGEYHQVTSGMFNSGSPVFDREGKYLYFASNREFTAPAYEDLGTTWIYADTTRLLMVPLRKDITSPFAPKSDEETWKEEPAAEKKDAPDKADGTGEKKEESGGENGESKDKKDDGGEKPEEGDKPKDGEKPGDGEKPKNDEKPKDKGQEKKDHPDDGDGQDKPADEKKDDVKDAKPAAAEGDKAEGEKKEGEKKDEKKEEKKLVIDIEGFEARAIPLPLDAGSFFNLAVNDKGHLIYGKGGSRGRGGDSSIHIFDPGAEKDRDKVVVAGTASFTLSADGKKLLIGRGGSNQYIVEAAAGQKLEEALDLSLLKTRIDPRVEWRQLLLETWRILRDFFYDPHMHGVDWLAVRGRYEAMLADCASREDVRYVMGEMIAELNVGHAYARTGGDLEQPPTESVGLLGCEFELHEGAYRIAKIYQGASWDSDARGPLSQPGVEAAVGDYILAVNREPIDVAKAPWAAFLGLGGKTAIITFSKKPTLDADAKEVILTLLGSDGSLKYRDWVEHHRAYVEKKSDGRIGYIHVPDTGVNGQNELVRQFFGQRHLAALIIDDRWNGGGQIPTRFIELLNRPVTNYWARRDGNDWTWPPDAHFGPKCMLINGLAGSGGDMFPALFKQAGLGKLIGMRTWGGLVGISGNPTLIDGGNITAPTFAYYEKNGTWGIEGHGVDPDMEVVDDPALMVDGGDPQLDAAIKHLQSELQRAPYSKPDRPAYPNRSGMGLKEEDK